MRFPRSSVLLSVVLVLSPAARAQDEEHSILQGPEQLRAELDALVAGHQYARVERIVEKLLERGDDPATTYFQIGKRYFDCEEWLRSAEFLQKSLKLNTPNDAAHELLGLAWRKLHRPDDAETELIEAARLNRSNKVSAYFAGHQLLLNGKFEAALPYLYSTLESKPLEPQALEALAYAQAHLGNYGLAESYFYRAIDSPQASEDERYAAFINLSVLLLMGHDPADLAGGLTCAHRAGKLKPDSPDAHFLAGKALFKLGRLMEATLDLEQATKLKPEDSKPHFLLARIYDQLGQHDRARKERESMARVRRRVVQGGMATGEEVQLAPE